MRGRASIDCTGGFIMNLSGILVISTPPEIDALVDTLNAIPSLEVHHIDRESSRLIVVQEAESVHDEVAGLKNIKKLPGIVLAEMVYHYFGEGNANAPETIPDDLDEYTGLRQSAVPDYLNE
jgi:nitrate reductase NapD